MENQTRPSPTQLGLIRAIGCLAYPIGAAIVAALAFMILRIV